MPYEVKAGRMQSYEIVLSKANKVETMSLANKRVNYKLKLEQLVSVSADRGHAAPPSSNEHGYEGNLVVHFTVLFAFPEHSGYNPKTRTHGETSSAVGLCPSCLLVSGIESIFQFLTAGGPHECPNNFMRPP
jgi:hypothetical protein